MKTIHLTLQNHVAHPSHKGYIALEKGEIIICKVLNLPENAKLVINHEEKPNNTFTLEYDDINNEMNFDIIVKENDKHTLYKLKGLRTTNYKILEGLVDKSNPSVIEKLLERIKVLEEACLDLYEKFENEEVI